MHWESISGVLLAAWTTTDGPTATLCLGGSWFDTWHSSSVFVWSDQRIFSSPSGAFLALQVSFTSYRVTSVGWLYHAGLILVVLQKWLSFARFCWSSVSVTIRSLSPAWLRPSLVPWLLRLAGRPPLGRVQVVPNFFHGGQCANWELQTATSFMYRSPVYFSRAHSACWCHFVCCKVKCTEASARWWLHQSA